MLVRPLQQSDADRWRALYEGYRRFYSLPDDPQAANRVWGWLLDPDHQTQGLVAEDESGAVQGIAHFRRFARPASATTGLWLDDLFVAPEQRGGGAGRALLEQLADIADREGLSVVRWITAQDNAGARRLYDAVGTATAWVTYDMAPRAASD